MKSSLRAPAVAAVRAAWANGDAEKWTDTWFSPGGQAAIKDAVARLNKPRK